MEFAWSPARLTGWLGGYLSIPRGAGDQILPPWGCRRSKFVSQFDEWALQKVVAGDRASGGHNKTEPRSLQNPEWLGIEEMARKEKLLPKVEAIR